MNAPPSRYKVVEQGRRLVVIDTWNGGTPIASAPPPSEKARRATPEQTRAALRSMQRARPTVGGSSAPAPVTITTQRWFDEKAPRRLRIEPQTQSKIAIALVFALVAAVLALVMIGWPAMVVAGVILAQPKLRKGLRSAITPMLDGLAAG